MKAIVFTEYGPPNVLHLAEVEKPVPKDNEILVKVYARPVSYGDITARNFSSITPRKFNMPLLLWFPTRLAFGLRKPRMNILGSEFAGEIEAVGQTVKRFKAGDQVYGYLGMNFGANAEYLCMPENGTVALKPANMIYEEAATVPYGAMMALNLLKKGAIQPGHKVLVNGASGGIGSYAVQFAKHYGAEVTGVCSTPRVDLVKSLGADHVIDYTQEDFTKNGQTYDLIFDILGKSSWSRCKNSLTKNGRYLLASFKMPHLFHMLRTSIASNKKVICTISGEGAEYLETIKEMVEAGEIKTVVDKCYPLEQAANAHQYVEAGHKKGHVVITSDHA